jgi:hypothetical protein
MSLVSQIPSMPDSEDSTDRVGITTYIPESQKAQWEAHASEFNMSQSEFVRSMVQAGRRGFDKSGTDSTGSSGSNPGGTMPERVLQALDTEGRLSWEELLEIVMGDVESRLEDAIVALQENDRIAHHPRDGTYSLQDDQ